MKDKKVKVIFISNGESSVSAKFNISESITMNKLGVRVSMNVEEYTLNKGYKYSIKAIDFDKFIRNCGIKQSEVEIDNDSLKEFYHFQGYSSYYSTKLLDYFLNNWVRFDYPIIKKYKVNFDTCCLDSFEVLGKCENGIFISKSINKKEIDRLESFLDKNSLMYEELQKIKKEKISSIYEIVS